MPYASRNEPLEFAKRTWKNLRHIETAKETGADVHEVTQLACSLLGLIVFPWEKDLVKKVSALKLENLTQNGWPRWEVCLGNCETLGQLIKHLRNAVAHGRMVFSSDSTNLRDVTFTVEDYYKGKKDPWCAHIRANDLRAFCLKFVRLLEGKNRLI